MSECGYIKLGGKSLDQIIVADFLDNELKSVLDNFNAKAIENSAASLASQGASPYHPELYRQIIQSPDSFRLKETKNAVDLVEQIYKLALGHK